MYIKKKCLRSINQYPFGYGTFVERNILNMLDKLFYLYEKKKNLFGCAAINKEINIYVKKKLCFVYHTYLNF